MKTAYAFLIFLIAASVANCKVLIITTAFNRPDFIELQDKHFKKFVKDDYEFVVFSDAPTNYLHQKMVETCQTLGLKCVRVPLSSHYCMLPSCRNATSILVALNEMGFDHDDLVAVVDSDLFLVRPFSFREYLGDCLVAALPQYREHVKYMWVGLMIFNMPLLPDRRELNFATGVVDGVPTDTGGYSYNYLKSHPEVTWKEINCSHILYIENPPEDLGEPTLQVIQSRIRSEFLLDFHFFHYQAGSNWNRSTYEVIKRKNEIANRYLSQMYDQGAEALTQR